MIAETKSDGRKVMCKNGDEKRVVEEKIIYLCADIKKPGFITSN
jgi:hypothetical protein